jgi:hypothetical protein
MFVHFTCWADTYLNTTVIVEIICEEEIIVGFSCVRRRMFNITSACKYAQWYVADKDPILFKIIFFFVRKCGNMNIILHELRSKSSISFLT